ncbi:hypothetical protein QQX09_04735 [Demequina sp. SYSU T00192]|uniref:Hemagglutinin-related protein n=1 Tax=Demequina litoralis TaxID=3051660 RepID=A0ABT8G8A3_9MICO|nr:hypothetical protein [Demequina sp. SYSU T00192]MDN4475164.1 hypothetical protein [Demequina sp. SYSU T00192]
MTARTLQRGALALGAALLAAIGVLVASPSAQALDGDDFKAGMIITDALFFDGTALGSAAIDSFIAAKNPGCAAGATCLENYRERITAKAKTDRCDAITAQSNATAGEIIAAVGKACDISPKAILTILQKEQSLVTSTAPSSRAFAYAMGAGCPDDGGCNTPYQGLYQQVYYGASLLKGYTLPTSSHYGRYAAGQTSAIQYNVPTSCGTKDVYVENQATHALYVYTPYTPNQAALNNLYGTGNSCSAYGNRNFWRMYNDWFGSTTAGQSLVKTATSNTVYLLTTDGRWALTGPVKAKDLAALGTVATVSKGYLTSYTNRGKMPRYVYDTGLDEVWVLYGRERHKVGGCGSKLVNGLGVDCADLPQMDHGEMLRLTTGTRLTPLLTTGAGAQYYVNRAGRHAISSAAAPADSGETVSAEAVTVPASILKDATRRNVMVADGEALTDGSEVVYRAGASLGRVSGLLWSQAGLAAFLPSPVTVAAADLKIPAAATSLSGFVRAAASDDTFMLTTSGLIDVGGSAPEGSVTVLDDALIASLPIVSTGMPSFLTDVGTKTTYLVDETGARALPAGVKVRETANSLGLDRTVVAVPSEVIEDLGLGPALLRPGRVVKDADTGQRWLIDGAATRWRVYARQAKELKVGSIETVDAARLALYTPASSKATIGVSCLREQFIIAGGKRYPVSATHAAEYEPVVPLSSVEWSTCRAIPSAGTQGGRVLLSPSGARFLVTDGTVHRLKASQKASGMGVPIPVFWTTLDEFPRS